VKAFFSLISWFTGTNHSPVPVPLPFDDGLVDLCRLIGLDDPEDGPEQPGCGVSRPGDPMTQRTDQ
jgi:hypothetical protein